MTECNSNENKNLPIQSQTMKYKKRDIVKFLAEAKKNPEKLYVVVCTYQSASKIYTRVGARSISVFDESHVCAGARNKKAAEALRRCKSRVILTMTATPRTFLRGKSKVSVVSCDDVTVFGEELLYTPPDGGADRRYTLRDAINDGSIVNLLVYLLFMDYDRAMRYAKTKKVRKKLSALREIDEEIGFQDRVNVHGVPTTPRELTTALSILKLLRQEEISHVLIFYNHREDSKDMKDLLGKLSERSNTNLSVRCVDYKDRGKTREEIFDAYRMSDIGVIVSVNTIAEGVNLNETDAVVLVDMTSSSIRITQITGRSLRRHVYKLREKVRIKRKKKMYVHCSRIDSKYPMHS